MEIVEVCRIVPSTLASPDGANDKTIPPMNSFPLTYFDLRWLRLVPSQCLYFYQISSPNDTETFFFDTILPCLKRSLSLALGHHFLPLAGEVTWSLSSPKPIFSLPEDGGGVSFTVAKSTADFDSLSSTDDVLCDATDLHPFVPELPESDKEAGILAFLVTVFPSGGFSIGNSISHSVLDGKSFTSFMRSWAHICQSITTVGDYGDKIVTSLPPELLPFYDRASINDPLNLGDLFADQWQNLDNGPGNTSVKAYKRKVPLGSVRGTFHFPKEKIENLRKSVITDVGLDEKTRISTLSLVIAFTMVRLIKAEEISLKKVYLIVEVNCRSRLEPPLPPTYVGNCVLGRILDWEAEMLLGKEGFQAILTSINEATKNLDMNQLVTDSKTWVEGFINYLQNTEDLPYVLYIITLSPLFQVYKTDFGWGPPRRFEMTSADVDPGTICLQDSKNGDGVEIALVMKKHHMVAFASLYAQGLESL